MAKVSITIPDIPSSEDSTYGLVIDEVAEILRDVADQVDDDFTSGYFEASDGRHYWSIEEG